MDYKLTAHFAKKLSCKGNGAKAEEAREYFTRVEEKAKEMAINVSALSPELQMFNRIFQSVAQQQLVQIEIKKQQEKMEKKLDTVVSTYEKTENAEDFKQWCKNCAGKIAKSEKLKHLGRSELYQVIWNESYQRLAEKRPCRLKQRLDKERGNALDRGKSQSWIKTNITYLSIIADDKDLKPAYEGVMREMMMYYCV